MLRLGSWFLSPTKSQRTQKPTHRSEPQIIPYVAQYCFRTGNRASGPDFGRAPTGKHQNRSSGQTQSGSKAGREPKENDNKTQTTTETQGPCPDLRGFCIKALTVYDDVPYWRLYVSEWSSGLVRDMRSKTKPGHKHTLRARRARNVCLCPGSAVDRRSRTSPDNPYDTYKRQ